MTRPRLFFVVYINEKECSVGIHVVCVRGCFPPPAGLGVMRSIHSTLKVSQGLLPTNQRIVS